VCIHREFSRKSVGERILKIGPHLPKLCQRLRGLLFLGHSVIVSRILKIQRCSENRKLNQNQSLIESTDL